MLKFKLHKLLKTTLERFSSQPIILQRSLNMRAVKVAQFGGLDALQVKDDLPIPTVSGSQLLIKVHAAGVNPVDTYIRSGQYKNLPKLPYTPGSDGAGVVQNDTDSFKKGERVYFRRTVTGSYAEYTVAENQEVFKLHDSLSFSQGAAMGVPYFTAYRALVHVLAVKAGQNVLVHGASGAVGLAACQLAKSLGLTVIGTAGTQQGMETVLKNGAHDVFNHRDGKDYTQKLMEKYKDGFTYILEMLANVNLEADLQMVKVHGKIAVIGNRGTIEITPRHTMAKESSIHGVMMGYSTPEEMSESAAYFAAGHEHGWLKPQVGQEYPLDQVQKAHEEVIAHSAGSAGKIVLKL